MTIRYIDTRGNVEEPLEFSEAVIEGLASGGGLLVPVEVPHMTLDEIVALGHMPYRERAAFVYERFGVDFSHEELAELFEIIYADNFDVPDICPVVPVGEDGTYVLELWHGPTSAFKDMALQCLPVFFSASVEKQRQAGGPGNDYLIAVATSGDTGKAALQGFANREHTSIVVYYPDGGVSDIQFKQMATQLGDNVCVYGVRGNFDDCQTSVKRMFNDAAFNARLLSEHNIALSSANSINWGRLLPQVVYYISAYAQLVASGAVRVLAVHAALARQEASLLVVRDFKPRRRHEIPLRLAQHLKRLFVHGNCLVLGRALLELGRAGRTGVFRRIVQRGDEQEPDTAQQG